MAPFAKSTFRLWFWLAVITTALLGGPSTTGLDRLHAADAPAPEWQKFKGKPEPLAPTPPFATPGQFLPRPDRTVTFPAGGLAIDLPLDAMLADGRSLKAALQPDRSLWIDLDGNGKTSTAERFSFTRTGYGPITVPLKYKNETTAPYSFHLVATATAGVFRLVTGQMIRYTIAWNRHATTVILIDQNNNGRYDDQGEDVVMIDNRPGAFLAKTVTVGPDAGSVAEVVVYPDGSTIEMREYTGDTGVLDPVSAYTPGTAGAGLQYLTLEGPLARPGFSAAFPRARVPVGDYNFTGAYVVNGAEAMRVERGGLPTTTVAKEATTKLAWGGKPELKYAFRRDGDYIVFEGFQMVGKEHLEIYHPVDSSIVPFRYHLDEYHPPSGGFTGLVSSGGSDLIDTGMIESDGKGGWKPVLYKHNGMKMILTFNASYFSGVMGNLSAKDNFEFSPPPAPVGQTAQQPQQHQQTQQVQQARQPGR